MINYLLATGMTIESTILQSISTIGFPIVMCVYLLRNMERRDSTHRQEIEKISEAVNNNTQAINMLIAKLTERD